MPWVEALSDAKDLRRCICDLVALSALPTTWSEYDPYQIADSVAAALVPILDAELVHVRIHGKRGEGVIEVLRIGDRLKADLGSVRAALQRHLPDQPIEETTELGSIDANGPLRLASIPLGFHSNGALVAGDSRPYFPTELQRLLLRIAANEMAIALDRWQAETDEFRFASLVATSPDLIGFATLDGWPLFLNPAGMKLVGAENLEEVCRTHLLDFLFETDRIRAQREIWPWVMQNGHWSGELNFRHFRTGGAIPFLVDWIRIDDLRSGIPMNLATVSRDLTAQKLAEIELRLLNATLEQRVFERTDELAEANEMLVKEMKEHERADAQLQELQFKFFHAARLTTAGQMAAALAHELNQPLTASAASVNTAKRLIKSNNLGRPDGLDESLCDASDQILRAGKIIHRLRDMLSRGETEQSVEDLSVIIREGSELALAGHKGSPFKVNFNIDRDAHWVIANRVQVQQVLVNLVRNAIEAIGTTRPGSITITARLTDAENVEVVVADNGPGLPQYVLSRLFEPFVSTKLDGMGLGLSICRSIVEAHGGLLSAKPNPGGGTIFRFTLAAAPGNGALEDV
jgi:signal transduction histidine kinase